MSYNLCLSGVYHSSASGQFKFNDEITSNLNVQNLVGILLHLLANESPEGKDLGVWVAGDEARPTLHRHALRQTGTPSAPHHDGLTRWKLRGLGAQKCADLLVMMDAVHLSAPLYDWKLIGPYCIAIRTAVAMSGDSEFTFEERYAQLECETSKNWQDVHDFITTELCMCIEKVKSFRNAVRHLDFASLKTAVSHVSTIFTRLVQDLQGGKTVVNDKLGQLLIACRLSTAIDCEHNRFSADALVECVRLLKKSGIRLQPLTMHTIEELICLPVTEIEDPDAFLGTITGAMVAGGKALKSVPLAQLLRSAIHIHGSLQQSAVSQDETLRLLEENFGGLMAYVSQALGDAKSLDSAWAAWRAVLEAQYDKENALGASVKAAGDAMTRASQALGAAKSQDSAWAAWRAVFNAEYAKENALGASVKAAGDAMTQASQALGAAKSQDSAWGVWRESARVSE